MAFTSQDRIIARMVRQWVISEHFPNFVIPTEAGIHRVSTNRCAKWIPAFAGMTPRDVAVEAVAVRLPGYALRGANIHAALGVVYPTA